MGSLSIWHWIIVLVVVLLLFGKNKIPGLMGDVAKGINAFKKGLKDGNGSPSDSSSATEAIGQTQAVHPAAEQERTADKSSR